MPDEARKWLEWMESLDAMSHSESEGVEHFRRLLAKNERLREAVDFALDAKIMAQSVINKLEKARDA